MSITIFAASDEWTAGIAGIAVIVGGGIQWFLQWLATYLRDKRATARKEYKEDEDGIIARYNELYQRVIADRADCLKENKALQDQIDDLQERTTKAMLMTSRAVGWIRHLEAVLEMNKVPYRPWQEGSGSGSPASEVKP